METKTIEKIELYVDNELIATMTEAPYVTEYTASSVGQDGQWMEYTVDVKEDGISGQQVGKSYKGIVVRDGKKVILK